ncbi:hypothetical protein HK101_009587 [Irineochytrium annulatum]|nr:hypothetical protein HK101_009587 [Irineochytrium annulatum]
MSIRLRDFPTKPERIGYMQSVLALFRDLHGDDKWAQPIIDHTEILDADVGKVTFDIILTRRHLNGRGFLHGGCLATLIDFYTSLAVISVDPIGLSGVSTDLGVSFIGAAKEGDRLRCVAEVTHHGNKLVFTSATVYVVEAGGEVGRVVGTGRHTKFRIGVTTAKPKL